MAKKNFTQQSKEKIAFGKLICKLRIKEDFSLRKLAEAIGLPASNLSYIENGVNSPTAEIYNKIINVLRPNKEEHEKLDKLYNLMTEAAEMISSNMYEDWMNSLDNYIQNIDLSKYIEIPKTSEELVGKVKELYMESRNKYINDNKSDYESTRNPITESDYQKFLNSFNKIK